MVTTCQVAQATDVGWAVFRAFADQEELLDACATEALSPANAHDELACVQDQRLAALLTETASALPARLYRVGPVVGARLRLLTLHH